MSTPVSSSSCSNSLVSSKSFSHSPSEAGTSSSFLLVVVAFGGVLQLLFAFVAVIRTITRAVEHFDSFLVLRPCVGHVLPLYGSALFGRW
jgi:hypothetical protein